MKKLGPRAVQVGAENRGFATVNKSSFTHLWEGKGHFALSKAGMFFSCSYREEGEDGAVNLWVAVSINWPADAWLT
ncbi:hypothetical protein C1X05_09080 [Laceyella sacchari]|nr:hypothetical protein C1X05_09080 [Laceyella sacchari]